MDVSEKLSRIIKQKEISYRELSNMTGIAKSAIQRYASGETAKIPIDRLKPLAQALGVSPAYLMGWEDDSPSAPPGEAPAPALTVDELTPDESRLVTDYRSLNPQGQEFIRQTMFVALPTYKKDPDLPLLADQAASTESG